MATLKANFSLFPSFFPNVPSSRRVSSSWKRNYSASTTSGSFYCKLTQFPSSSASQLKPSLIHSDESSSNTGLAGFGASSNGTKGIEELVQRVRRDMFINSGDPMRNLKLVDTLQRLGIAYHFDEEVNAVLDDVMSRRKRKNEEDDLFVTALRFRLLRQNGYHVSPDDAFHKFINKEGKFQEALSNDIVGMLSLYEVSYLGAKGEEILSEAMEFTKNNLRTSMPNLDLPLAREVGTALEVPRHLRMVRLEARRYIDEYALKTAGSTVLVELAKLDFNNIQLLHQMELAEVIRWWKELGLVEKLSFARDRPLECFLWTVGIFPDPWHSKCRIELTKTIAILLVIDDIFDSYGSIEELVLFNNAIQRWDLEAIEQLPEYMKICYMALFNTTNEIGYRVFKEHGWSIIPHLKRTWIDMFEGFLVEAKWFNKKYVPTQEEHLVNGVTTAGTYMALVHAFFLMGEGVTKETIKMMEPYPMIFSHSGMILRLWDDLGTWREEQERGDVASSIECAMREHINISSVDEACDYIRQLIHNLWTELNGQLVAPEGLPLSIIKASLNLSRTSQVIYQQGYDNNASTVEDNIQLLLFRPIP
ncbi:probable terpene synthase 11 [Telopea speciosissima]|uniref:probable terpene synthase 11 n=1 Tax=Telopea speciosissima TaxID=54955 RepID=UPI001CC438AA|nr:probable terpene synthase 11 [Telopea speciosissima]